jgi:hypothetical protein
MVIKATVIHSGWSYGKGDDQYDNESLCSTETVGIQSVIESRRSNRVSMVFRARARVIKETVIPF